MSDAVHPLAGVLAGFARLVSGVQVRWVECRPATHQRVYFANHTSHLDFVVLWSALPREVRVLVHPVAAQDYWGKTALRRYVATHVFRAVLIERNPRAHAPALAAARMAIERLVAALGDRDSLIVFPEGTRGDGEAIRPFKSGLYHLCLRCPDLELIPVYLRNLNRILPKGEILPVPLLSSVSFGPPMRLLEGEPKNAFLERAREAVCRLKPQ